MGNEKEHFGRPAKVRNYGSHFGWMDGWKERKGTGRTGESKGESGFTFVYVTRVLAPFLRLLPATAMMMMMSPVQPGLHLSPYPFHPSSSRRHASRGTSASRLTFTYRKGGYL